MEIQCRSINSTDPHIEAACKDLMSMDWDEIPCSVVNEINKSLSKTTNDTFKRIKIRSCIRVKISLFTQ
ncbi:hypothetical protein MA16_Dca027856 [Dendrobium catenatum]|uniref:Uncharacterized protein n=1 Tax=Dendrobium catenatum TaxID=906689 RepID=A0A2I0VQ45_9ASPA|nr:hypothetical protein MA16_Dca027856 [Dendrobium catenatum]